MFSYLLSPASSYCQRLHEHALTIRPHWQPGARLPEPLPPGQSQENIRAQEIYDVLSTNDLYHILSVTPSPIIDNLTLRRAYLLRSKACHPDKCPGNPDATHAFQRVSIAYNVLSKPSLKRMYDALPANEQPDFLRSPPCGYADETLKGVLLSIVSDFLDGNLEMIRTLLQAISDLNPSLKLSDEGINTILSVLSNIRVHVLAWRACIFALHTELVRVLELQYAFRQLPYLDVTGRSRLTIQLTRITLSLPVTLEKAIQDAQKDLHQNGATADGQSSRTSWGESTRGERDRDKAALLPKHVIHLIRGIDMVLDKMERILG